MGGGDLNSKKSWHPNTMKNQDNVRKAEEMAASEKRRIKELQQQYDEEKEREELNKKIKSNAGAIDDNRLHWMYDKPDKSVQQEDYLLGKAIDKRSDINKMDDDVIPAVARRVVGSSMMAQTDDTQVDLARKIREDPLLLVKERERAARAALLNNPLQRKKLTELLRKEQEQNKVKKAKKKSKKKDKDLDNMLAAKLSAIVGNKGIDLKSLLDTDDSSEKEKSKKKKKKRKHEKRQKKKKQKYSSDGETSDSDPQEKNIKEDNVRLGKKESPLRKRRSDSTYSDTEIPRKRDRRDTTQERQRHDNGRHREDYRKEYSRDKKEAYKGSRSTRGMDEVERAARLAEMVAAGKERETERGRRVAQERRRDNAAAAAPPALPGPSALSEARALPDSLQSRIHSTRHYIQRDRRHMNEHFARR